MKSVYYTHFTPGPRGRREQEKRHNTNEYIRAQEVRLIDQNGEMLGIVPTKEALQKSKDAELDLVEIAPKAAPPVCKIIDYGKFIYELQKKEKAQRKAQQQSQMKEVRFKWRTAEHDFNFKTRHARNFIEDGNKVKASVMFRGREITHQEIGRELLKKFIAAMEDVAKIDAPIKFEGRNLSAVLAPLKTKKK